MDKFILNKEKTVATMLYVASKIPGIQYHQLLKIVYFADLKHLSEYGRQITGDYYVAMKDGPVASWLYDLLKKNKGEHYWHLFEVGWFKKVTPKGEPDMNVFSKSDIECLDASITDNAGVSFGELKSRSHDSAWTYTWNNIGKNREISLTKLVEASGAGKEMIEYLENREEYSISRPA